MDRPVHLRAEIVERRDLTADLWIVRIRPERPLVFRPGQFATLGVQDGLRWIERPYSIASSPLEPELEFFLERVPEGDLSQRLHGLRRGDPVFVRSTPKGRFLFDLESGHTRHLALATVTGVAPFVSMVRTRRLEQSEDRSPGPHRVFLLQGASFSRELGYDRELAELQRTTNWFQYVPTVSRPREDPGWRGERGRVHGLLPKYLDRFQCRPAETTAYLCGHPGMIQAGRETLCRAGFEKASIREERFWVSSAGSR